MGATPQEINNYLQAVRYAVSNFSAKVANKELLGHTDIFCDRQRIILLTSFLEILESYFSQTDYENNNFFTKEEITDVMQHINRICKTDYILTTL